MSAVERNHWRDEKLSERHRSWGYNCPGVDIDWFFVEYDLAKPVAFVDYKLWMWPRRQPFEPDTTDANVKAFREAAERAGVAGLVVQYIRDPWAFCVWPLNRLAEGIFRRGESLTERQYVERLYRLRKRIFDEYVATHLMDISPPWLPHTLELLR